MADSLILTCHAQVLHWAAWDKSIPDLSPSSVTSELFMDVRTASENAALELLLPKMKKMELEGQAWDGPRDLDELFNFAFNEMDEDAMKIMKKAFDIVFKTWWTITFVHPSDASLNFTGYCPPHKARALMEQASTLHRARKALEDHPEKSEMEIRLEMLKGNCAVPSVDVEDLFYCGQPVSCKKLCSFWFEPEPDSPYKCYFAERNADQQNVDDAFLCLCEEAWNEKRGAK